MGIDVKDRRAFKTRMNEALRFDKRRAAVLTIDLQREYLDESVGQSVAEPEEAARVMRSNKVLLDACRAVRIP